MYKNIYFDKKKNICYLWDDAHPGVTEFPFRNYAFQKKHSGKYRSIYGDALEKTYYVNPRDPSQFESDVPIETKILIDLYEDSDEPSTGHKVGTIDIETYSADGFSSPEDANNEITAIALHDSSNNQYTAYLLDKENRIGNFTSTAGVSVICVDNEVDLLKKFLSKWEELAFSIVTGWNISGYDCPYLYNRLSKVLGKEAAKRLSPIKICYVNTWNKNLIIAGISCLDYMDLYKKYADKVEPSYALGVIGKKVVGLGKMEFTGSLHDLYKTDINKYLEYNINDVKIVVELEKKLQYIDLARKICHTGHVAYENYRMSSRYLEGSILTYLRRNGGLIAPNKPIDGKEEYDRQNESGEDGFIGGYVKEPIPGKYKWLYDLDLTSMYPNIMISLNISPETKVGKIDVWDSDKYASGESQPIIIGGNSYTTDEFKKLISDNNLSVASNGVMYKKPTRTVVDGVEKVTGIGVIPSILIKWFDERKALRKLAKKCADEKNWEQYEFYDQRQKIQKILLNSSYGVLGLATFRFFDKDNASAVTLTGQTIIKTAGKAVNQFYKSELGSTEDVDYVIYCDTDSLFASASMLIKHYNPTIDINDESSMTGATLSVCSKVQSFVNRMFDVMASRMFNLTNHRFDIKQEVVAKSGFFLAKKRYVQLIINKGGIVCDEMEIKGIDVVRSGFPFKFREFMKQFLMDLLTEVSPAIIDDKILQFKDDINKLSIIDIAKNTSVKFVSLDKLKDYDPGKRAAFNFVKGTPAQVKAALAYNDLLHTFKLDKHVSPIFNGQKVKWVYLGQNIYGLNCVALKADGTDPAEILDFITAHLDRQAMYEQELKSKLIDFYAVLGWAYPDEGTRNAGKFFEF